MIASALPCPWCGTLHQVMPTRSRCTHCGLSFPGGALLELPKEARPSRFHRLLKERYLILKLAGMGSLGVVYEALDIQHYRHVAIKELRPASRNPHQLREAVGLFQAEAQTFARCEHASLLRVYDHFEESGHFYLVTEFIWGRRLTEYLTGIPEQALSLDQVLQVGIQLCQVLQYLHTRPDPLILGDLKPASILLSFTGNVYLVDLGGAYRRKTAARRGAFHFGVPGYSAPESSASGGMMPRSDLYSLGTILRQLITEESPVLRLFPFAPLNTERYAFPIELARLLMRMVDPVEDKRPESAASVECQLQAIYLSWESGKKR